MDFEVWLHTSENAGFFVVVVFSCQWVWTNLSILYLFCKANRRMRELGGNEAHCAVSNLCFCNTNRSWEKETQAFLCYLGVACHSNNTVTHWMYQNSKSVDCAIVVYFHFRNESHGAVVSYNLLSSLSGEDRIIAKTQILKLCLCSRKNQKCLLSNTSFHPAVGYSC